MTRSRYFSLIAVLAVFAAVLPALLWGGLGDRWFSFYGWATVVLVILPLLLLVLVRRYNVLGRSRWPVFVFALPVLLAAGTQIGFWATFFNVGPDGILLGAGRSMLLPYIDIVLPIAGSLAALLLAWFIWRGNSTHKA